MPTAVGQTKDGQSSYRLDREAPTGGAECVLLFDTITNLVRLTIYSVNMEHNHSFYM